MTESIQKTLQLIARLQKLISELYQITQLYNLDKGGSLQEGTLLRKAPNVDASFRDHDNSTLVFDVESSVLLASTLFHIEFIQTFHLSTCVFNQ
jgi:hypothetical protein